MGLKLRRGMLADSAECGRICFEAFKNVSERHRTPQDFPSPEVASGLMALLLAHPYFYSTAAELDGRRSGAALVSTAARVPGHRERCREALQGPSVQ